MKPASILMRELVCNLRDAVVTVSSHTINDDSSVTITRGNGFLIKGYYIICPTALVTIRHKTINKILVDIANVNGLGHSYSYFAIIIGLDGAGNIAVLRLIDVILDTHPHLNWGKSRNTSAGDKVLLIGDTIGKAAENAVAITTLADNRYVSPDGTIPGELLLLDSPCRTSGIPIITIEGKLVGMLVEKGLALSEFFMRRSVKSIILAHQNNGPTTSYFDFFEIRDNIYYYVKASLGLRGNLITQDDYETIICDGHRYPLQSLINPREIIGYRITDVGICSILQVGDMITHVNDCPLGDRKGQISPTLVMWRIKPGSIVTIKYRRQCEGFKDCHIATFTTISHSEDYVGTNVVI